MHCAGSQACCPVTRDLYVNHQMKNPTKRFITSFQVNNTSIAKSINAAFEEESFIKMVS